MDRFIEMGTQVARKKQEKQPTQDYLNLTFMLKWEFDRLRNAHSTLSQAEFSRMLNRTVLDLTGEDPNEAPKPIDTTSMSNLLRRKDAGEGVRDPMRLEAIARYWGITRGELQNLIAKPSENEVLEWLEAHPPQVRSISNSKENPKFHLGQAFNTSNQISTSTDDSAKLLERIDQVIAEVSCSLAKLREIREEIIDLTLVHRLQPTNKLEAYLMGIEERFGERFFQKAEIGRDRFDQIKNDPTLGSKEEYEEIDMIVRLLTLRQKPEDFTPITVEEMLAIKKDLSENTMSSPECNSRD